MPNITPTYTPTGWRPLLKLELVEIGDWFWAVDCYLPVLLGSKLADKDSYYVRKLVGQHSRGKW